VQQEATVSRLNVTTRATKAVVEVEMAKGGIDVIAVQPIERLGAEINAFRVTGWSIETTLGLKKSGDFGGSVPAGCRLLLVGRRWLIVVLLRQDRMNRRREGRREETHQQSAGNAGHSKGHGSLDLFCWADFFSRFKPEKDGRFP
jgi:hypothetical protein